MQANSELIQLMETDSDPRFQESQFLQFIKKIESGEFEIKDNTLLINSEKKHFDIRSNGDYINFIKEQLEMEQAFVSETKESFNDFINDEDLEEFKQM